MKAKVNSNSDRKLIHKGRFLDLFTIGEWEYFQRCNCTGIVIIVAMTDEKNILFVEQYRPPVGKIVIEFPAGLINDEASNNETIKSAARRELLEETGYEAKSVIDILSGPVSAGSSSDMVNMVYANGLKKKGNGGGIGLEDIVVHLISKDRTHQWLEMKKKEGCLIEPKIYTGLYFLERIAR